MERLTLETFIYAAEDPEYSQYRVLAIIKNYLEELHHSKLYPVFSDLIEVNNSLSAILQQRKNFSESLHRRIIGFNIKDKEVIYERTENLKDKLLRVFDFIKWAMPKIEEGLKEAKAIYDFVDNSIKVKEVGIIPLYKKEGYFVIKNNLKGTLNIYKYEMHIIPSNVSLRTLKTSLVDVIDEEESRLVLKNLKLELTSRYTAMPNPAIYFFETEIDFPFKETVLPIAKRKLMKVIAA